MASTARGRECEAYVANVGHEPNNLPEDHPDHWQWVYRGRSPEDRQRLAELLWLVEEELPAQEETLF